MFAVPTPLLFLMSVLLILPAVAAIIASGRIYSIMPSNRSLTPSSTARLRRLRT